MPKIHFTIPYPTFIESIIVYFLLRCRKKHYGFAFRLIKLTNGKPAAARYAVVDPDDYHKLAKEDWQLYENSTDNYYAVRLEGKNLVRMHRVIMNAPPGKIVDHRNGNGLDNTKQNLRFATPSQNSCNCRRRQKDSSKYRGVYFAKNRGKWRVQINYNGTRRHLGYFDNEEDAARAYDNAVMLYHGDFAVLNFESTEPGAIATGEFKSDSAGDKKEQAGSDEAARKYYGEYAVVNFGEQRGLVTGSPSG